MLTGGGGGGKICQNLADVICERSLLICALLAVKHLPYAPNLIVIGP